MQPWRYLLKLGLWLFAFWLKLKVKVRCKCAMFTGPYGGFVGFGAIHQLHGQEEGEGGQQKVHTRLMKSIELGYLYTSYVKLLTLHCYMLSCQKLIYLWGNKDFRFSHLSQTTYFSTCLMMILAKKRKPSNFSNCTLVSWVIKSLVALIGILFAKWISAFF